MINIIKEEIEIKKLRYTVDNQKMKKYLIT